LLQQIVSDKDMSPGIVAKWIMIKREAGFYGF